MEPNDEDLVLACRRGDATAWETLVIRYQRLIYSIPRRAGLDEDASADVFQRVFTTLIEKIDSIEQPARISAWLSTTARRETWRVSRHQRTRTSFSSDDESMIETLVDEALLPDDLLLRMEEQHQVRTAVAALDDRCRKLLTMLFYQSYPPSYTELAATLGISEGSIGPTRARCLQKMRRLLEHQG